jgi:hypothetical protein
MVGARKRANRTLSIRQATSPPAVTSPRPRRPLTHPARQPRGEVGRAAVRRFRVRKGGPLALATLTLTATFPSTGISGGRTDLWLRSLNPIPRPKTTFLLAPTGPTVGSLAPLAPKDQWANRMSRSLLSPPPASRKTRSSPRWGTETRNLRVNQRKEKESPTRGKRTLVQKHQTLKTLKPMMALAKLPVRIFCKLLSWFPLLPLSQHLLTQPPRPLAQGQGWC